MNPRTILLLSFIVFFFLFSWCEGGRKGYDKGIKGMFVFGSSLVDNGNNNVLENSRAKANYLPYGMDFPLGPSGRFTNGKNVIDFLGDYLGLPSSIPTFSDPSTKGMKIVHGVNYASGGSGILDNTGIVSVSHIQKRLHFFFFFFFFFFFDIMKFKKADKFFYYYSCYYYYLFFKLKVL